MPAGQSLDLRYVVEDEMTCGLTGRNHRKWPAEVRTLEHHRGECSKGRCWRLWSQLRTARKREEIDKNLHVPRGCGSDLGAEEVMMAACHLRYCWSFGLQIEGDTVRSVKHNSESRLGFGFRMEGECGDRLDNCRDFCSQSSDIYVEECAQNGRHADVRSSTLVVESRRFDLRFQASSKELCTTCLFPKLSIFRASAGAS